MNYESLFQVVLIAVSYFLFSNQFFKFCAEIREKKVSPLTRFFSFMIVYVWFIIAGLLELPLVTNWLVFLILLGLEVHFVFSYGFLTSYALSMFCVIAGLAVNVFFRSLVSILLDVPLNLFDKTFSPLKAYPIFLGFMFMVFLLRILRRMHFPSKLKTMLQYKESLIFYAWIEFFIYLFLVIQLLAYSQSENAMGIKTWGIKSALFSVIILIITIIYSLRAASLNYYLDKRLETYNHLIQGKKDINKLWALAFTDTLTGCSNRQLLDKRLKEYAQYGGFITLAFIDVNGLKNVNDQYGHIEGDNYLLSIVRTLSQVIDNFSIDLFRYGGDEFVMLSNSLSEAEITALLTQANRLLQSEAGAYYKKSVSYGVVYGNCGDYQNLLSAADQKMYLHKQKFLTDFTYSPQNH